MREAMKADIKHTRRLRGSPGGSPGPGVFGRYVGTCLSSPLPAAEGCPGSLRRLPERWNSGSATPSDGSGGAERRGEDLPISLLQHRSEPIPVIARQPGAAGNTRPRAGGARWGSNALRCSCPYGFMATYKAEAIKCQIQRPLRGAETGAEATALSHPGDIPAWEYSARQSGGAPGTAGRHLCRNNLRARPESEEQTCPVGVRDGQRP